MDRKINKVAIYNNNKEKSIEVEEKLKKDLKKLGLEVVDENYDLAISIGGDGTFLKMVNKTNFKEDIYYVGINTGTLGFLQELTTEDYKKFLDDIINNILTMEETFLEEINVIAKNNTYHFLALNEVVIRRKDLKVLESKIKVDDVLLEDFAGDGLLISTNVGSTAYNLSLGGSIIDKNITALSLTPIAPLRSKMYQNLNNSIILSKERIIELEPKHENLMLTIDGINKEIDDVIKIQVKISEHKIKCLKGSNDNFIKTIHDKLIGNLINTSIVIYR